MASAGGERSLSRFRLFLIFLFTAATLVALTGMPAHALFRQPTTLKYAVSVTGPAVLVLICASELPLRVMVGAIIALAPFATLETTFSGAPTPLAAVLVGGAIVVAVVHSPMVARPSPLAYAAVLVVLLLAEPIVAGSSVAYNVLWLAGILAVAWLVRLAAMEPGGLKFVLGALALGTAVQAALALYEFRTGHLINFYGGAGSNAFGQDYFFTFGHENRPIGSFNDPIALGNVLALSLPLLIVLAHLVREWTLKLVVVAIAALVALALALSLSRMSWIGAAVGVAVTLVFLPRGRRGASTVVVAAILVVALAVAGASAGASLIKRAESILQPTASTSTTAAGDIQREHIWSAALSIFSAHPAVGIGVNNINAALARRTSGINQYSHAHSTYLQALAEAGICGALALLAAWLAAGTAILGGLRRAMQEETRLLAAGLAGSAVAILITWLTDYTIRQISVATFIAMFFGLVAVLYHRTPKEVGLR